MKECFIVEDGVERILELEDILSLIDETGIQLLFRDAIRANVDLPYALAHMANEIKDKVYRNLPLRIRQVIEKDVKAIESTYEKEDNIIRHGRKKLISLIGENKSGWLFGSSERMVWREFIPEKGPSKKELPEKETPDPIKELTKKIEEACNSGSLNLAYDANKMSKDDVQKAFAEFQSRKNKLQKIRSLSINAGDLPAAALLFEAGGIEKLDISESAETWPEFLEKCQTLTTISLITREGLAEFPPFIRNAVSLRHLYIHGVIPLPDWIGELQSLTDLYIDYNKLKTIPGSIGNLRNLEELNISSSGIEKLPDSIGNLISLKRLFLHTYDLISLPDSIGNLKNLTLLILRSSYIESLPNGIGDLEKLDQLSLIDNENLKCLPDSIGKLKNLTTLVLRGSAVEKLPETMANCSSLEYIDIRHTNIGLLPDFISSVKTLEQSIEVIPIKNINSYRSFCNCCYTLTANLIKFAILAHAEGILSLEEELQYVQDYFFNEGLWLLVDGTDSETIQHILTLKIEREGDHYKKKLMETAMEGILSIHRGDSIPHLGIKLALMVNIKNNPLDAAFAKYLAGDVEAFDNINFRAALRPEEEREEIRFIKRAREIYQVCCCEGPLRLEKHLDIDGIAARDIFEYGLCLMAEYWDYKDIDKVLTMLAACETYPQRINLAMAKKEAVKMIYDGHFSAFIPTLLAYFDDDVAEEWRAERDE